MGTSTEGEKKGRETWSLVAMGLSEMLGTALLLLFGCMGGLPGIAPSQPPHLQAALNFGITVSTIIQIFGHVSGAHLNPAVTIAAWILGYTPIIKGAIFIVAQFIGAILGFSVLILMTPKEAFFARGMFNENSTHSFCVTEPGENVSVTQALLGEFFATSMLILLCCGVWDRRNEAKQDGVSLKFGLTIAALAMAEGPYSGCSMNPARTFGPAIITGAWKSHWIYWLGPLAAGIIMSYLYRYVFDRDHAKPRQLDQAEIPLNHVKADLKQSLEALP